MYFDTQLKHSELVNFIRKHRRIVVFFTIALLFDSLSTIYFMTQESIELEIHPLVYWGAVYHGPVMGVFLMSFLFKIAAGLLVSTYIGKHGHYVLIVTICTTTFAGFYNLFGESLFSFLSM